MTDDIRAIRDALADPGLTHGEWVACGPSFGEPLPRYLSEVIRPDDADGGDAVARAMGGMEADSSADMAYIAAVHPERIARLLDALEQAQKDADRYRYLRDRVPAEVLGQVKSAAGCWIDCEDDEGVLTLLTGSDADAAIDAAMKRGA